MADTAVLLEIITYIFQRTPPTADCDEPLKAVQRINKLPLLQTSFTTRKKMFSYTSCTMYISAIPVTKNGTVSLVFPARKK